MKAVITAPRPRPGRGRLTNIGEKMENFMYVKVGNVQCSVEREKLNVHIFDNTSTNASPVPSFLHPHARLSCH